MKAQLTLADCAVLLEVGKRQVQRLIQRGELCGAIDERGRRIVPRESLLAYMGKKEALQADTAPISTADVPQHPPKAIAEPEPSVPNSGRIPAPEPPSTKLVERPAWTRPAVEGGPLTNVPHWTSGNMPAPETLREHYENEARKLVEQFTGASHGKPEEYEHDFTI